MKKENICCIIILFLLVINIGVNIYNLSPKNLKKEKYGLIVSPVGNEDNDDNKDCSKCKKDGQKKCKK